MKFYDTKDTALIRRKYSICKLIRRMSGDMKADIGFEAEISKDLELKHEGEEKARTVRGFLVPSVALMRAFDVGTYGTPLVATNTTENFIEALASRTILGKCGMDILTNLKGDVKIPKETAVSTYWITDEGANATEVNPLVGSAFATPHTIGCYTDITRRMIVQTSRAAETFVARVIAKSIARGIESAGLNGSGNDGVPLGIANTEGVQNVTLAGASIAKADMVEWVNKALNENAEGEGTNAWVGTPDVLKALASTDDGHNHYLVENRMAEGYPFHASTLCPTGKLVFADWRQLLFCAWGEVDLVPEKNTIGTNGDVRLLCLQDVDFVVKNPKAFVVGTAVADE